MFGGLGLAGALLQNRQVELTEGSSARLRPRRCRYGPVAPPVVENTVAEAEQLESGSETAEAPLRRRSRQQVLQRELRSKRAKLGAQDSRQFSLEFGVLLGGSWVVISYKLYGYTVYVISSKL